MNPHSYRLKGRDFVHQGKIEIDVNERAVFIRTQGCFFVYTNSDCFLNILSNYDDFRKYSVEEIGNMFGIGKTKTRELLQSRLLPVTKIGRDYFTSKTAIQDFLNKNVGKELFF